MPGLLPGAPKPSLGSSARTYPWSSRTSNASTIVSALADLTQRVASRTWNTYSFAGSGQVAHRGTSGNVVSFASSFWAVAVGLPAPGLHDRLRVREVILPELDSAPDVVRADNVVPVEAGEQPGDTSDLITDLHRELTDVVVDPTGGQSRLHPVVPVEEHLGGTAVERKDVHAAVTERHQAIVPCGHGGVRPVLPPGEHPGTHGGLGPRGKHPAQHSPFHQVAVPGLADLLHGRRLHRGDEGEAGFGNHQRGLRGAVASFAVAVGGCRGSCPPA